MFTDHRPVGARLAAAAVGLVVALLACSPAWAAPGTARADTVQEEIAPQASESPEPQEQESQELTATERIVAALEESPVYVDPTFAGAFPEERAQDLEERITDSGVPLRVLVIPLIEGGEWSGDAGVLAAAVHDRIGGEAHYLVLDGRTLTGRDFVEWTEDSVERARYGTYGVSEEMEYDAPAAERVERAVEIALSDDPEGIYREAVEARESGPFDWLYSLRPDLYTTVVILPWVLAGLALFGLGVGIYRWRRPRAVPTLPQHAAFDNANQARRDELAERAGQELVEVGERLSAAVPVADDPDATAELHRALDAHAAARRIHDALPAEGALPDIVGVLVLLEHAEDHMARALRPAARRRSVPVRAHCYANPLHGTGTKVTRWREFGGRGDIRVPLCAECAKAVRDRSRPRVLPDRHGGREVPYYEVPATESVWAATGYGALRSDLVDRVLRGDHTARRR